MCYVTCVHCALHRPFSGVHVYLQPANYNIHFVNSHGGFIFMLDNFFGRVLSSQTEHPWRSVNNHDAEKGFRVWNRVFRLIKNRQQRNYQFNRILYIHFGRIQVQVKFFQTSPHDRSLHDLKNQSSFQQRSIFDNFGEFFRLWCERCLLETRLLRRLMSL